MIPLFIDDKKIQLPTCWEDVTFRQYLDYAELGETELINVVALFTGISQQVWEASKEIEGFYYISESLKFLEKEPNFENLSNPGHVVIDGKKYNIPTKLESYSVKQFEDMRGLIRMETKGEDRVPLKAYPKIAAIYFCTLLFKKYSMKNIEKAEAVLMDLPVYEVVGIVNFFLKNLTGLLIGMSRGSNIFHMIVKKLKRGLKGSKPGASLML